MKNKKINIKKLFRWLALSLFLSAPFLVLAAPFTYTPMEQIPGQATVPTDFYVYVSYIYRFGIGAVGIAALLMITIGGFMYATSAGNNASMEKAKGVITDAVVGLILALVSYVILYAINPDLVRIKRIAPQATTVPGAPGVGVPPVGIGMGTMPLRSPRSCTGGSCTQVDSAIQANASSVDPAILKSLISGGEGCNASSSPKGACGYSQLMPANRSWCGITGTAAQTCQAVQNDVQLAVNCAARLLKNDMMQRCGQDMFQLASCYNTGKKDNCLGAQNNYCGRVTNYYANSCG